MASISKIYAPPCALPYCNKLVNFKRRSTKVTGGVTHGWHTLCAYHKGVGRGERDNFCAERGGCENRDGRLGFTCQNPLTDSLHLDHWDGNKFNDDASNIIVLCANCHQAKTKMHSDHLNRYVGYNQHFDNLFDEINLENAKKVNHTIFPTKPTTPKKS